MDGRIATKTGDSQWISGQESLRFTHELRNDHEGILVGIGTILKDDPRLTCRIPGGRDPIKIILDSNLRIPETSQVLKDPSVPTWIYTLETSKVPRPHLNIPGVEIIPLPPDQTGQLSLVSLLQDLKVRGLHSLFVEGGARIITSFLKKGFCDRLAVVTAPILIGEGVSGIGDLGIEKLSQAKKLRSSRISFLGDDLLWDLNF